MTAAEALEEKLVVPDAAELVTATATAQSSCVLSWFLALGVLFIQGFTHRQYLKSGFLN